MRILLAVIAVIICGLGVGVLAYVLDETFDAQASPSPQQRFVLTDACMVDGLPEILSISGVPPQDRWVAIQIVYVRNDGVVVYVQHVPDGFATAWYVEIAQGVCAQ